MKPYSISLHNGTSWSRQHNIRGAGLAEKEEHIDPDGYRNILIDKPLKKSYQETFGKSVLEYNAKQTRSDRHIVDYLTKIKEEHKRAPSKKPHASYEMIVEIGNRDHHPSIKKSEQVLEAWLDEFQKNNPNVVVFGAYFHADEPESGPHMHVDYYFVKRQNKRGMSLQVSQNGALKEQGYTPITENGKFVTPQTQFVRNSRELLRNLSKEHGLYVEEQPRSGKNRRHLDTKEFKQTTKLKELENEIEEQQSWADNARAAAIEERKKLSKLQVDKENLEFWLKKNNATLETNNKLKSEVKELKKEVSFLKTAINILQRAFDFGKKLFEKYNLEENGKKINLWQKFKNSFREEKGETEYENFQKVRHDTSINEVLYRHEVDYLDGTRRDAPPGLGYDR
ncbi:hypothetical protein HO520_10705 [Streptococcus suis]|nr:hypothetical protein [Streptococcus suis]